MTKPAFEITLFSFYFSNSIFFTEEYEPAFNSYKYTPFERFAASNIALCIPADKSELINSATYCPITL